MVTHYFNFHSSYDMKVKIMVKYDHACFFEIYMLECIYLIASHYFNFYSSYDMKVKIIVKYDNAYFSECIC